MDITTLTLVELRELQQQIPSELRRREAQEKSNLIKEVRALAKERGFTIEDLLSKDEAKRADVGSKVRIKYRHPQDANLTWTGRGRKPKWVETWLATGGTLEGILV